MTRAALIALLLLTGCAQGPSVGCTTIIGTPVNRQTSQNNFRCMTGEILVGYNPDGLGGPLICATQTTSCPIPAAK